MRPEHPLFEIRVLATKQFLSNKLSTIHLLLSRDLFTTHNRGIKTTNFFSFQEIYRTDEVLPLRQRIIASPTNINQHYLKVLMEIKVLSKNWDKVWLFLQEKCRKTREAEVMAVAVQWIIVKLLISIIKTPILIASLIRDRIRIFEKLIMRLIILLYHKTVTAVE